MANKKIEARNRSLINGNSGVESSMSMTIDDKPFTPQELREYTEINPDFGRTLLQMAKDEQDHRHTMDKKKADSVKLSQWSTLTTNLVGMLLAFFIVISFIGASLYALYLDKPWFAGIIGCFGVAAIVKLFIPSKERINK